MVTESIYDRMSSDKGKWRCLSNWCRYTEDIADSMDWNSISGGGDARSKLLN